MTVTIELTVEQYEALAELARQRGVTVEEVARAAAVAESEKGQRFRATAEYVLEKNADLYRRLAKG